jgi:lipid-A-disaccharide synthase
MVVAYKVPVFEELIARAMIKVPSVVLANLVIGESVVPEFLQWDCTKRNLAAALVPLVADGPERARQTEAFARLDEIMEIGRTLPSSRAAEIVLRYATRRPDSRTVASAAPASA